jgi:hypothetical protein
MTKMMKKINNSRICKDQRQQSLQLKNNNHQSYLQLKNKILILQPKAVVVKQHLLEVLVTGMTLQNLNEE